MFVIESQYFPPISVFKMSVLHKELEIDVFSNFKKASFRNRCIISGSNGLMSLTVPIKGGRTQKSLMKDVEIDYSESWQRSHQRSLASSYSNAPFYHHYHNEVDALILSNEKYLVDLNCKILSALLRLLKLSITTTSTSHFNDNYNSGTDCRDKFLPNNFQAGLQDWKPVYPQVFEDRFGFQPNLSILDLLFCQGPAAAALLNVS